MFLKNRYRVLQTLSSGGFGETFIAEDTQLPVSCRCVVKRLKPIADDPDTYQFIQERFKREAAILQTLGSHSDQIPSLHAYFEEDNYFYLVQELIDGKTLTEFLQDGGILNEIDVRRFLSNFLLILDYVHAQKIIHRDIKPDNIIIRASNQKPVLIDFGAVKELMGTQFYAGASQPSSIVIGTRGFMPSEQANGRPVYSSDLYATALVAIYLLTGKFPQEITTDQATGQLNWKQYAPQVSSSLALVLDCATQPHARDRYSTASEMIQALNGNVIQPPQPPTQVSNPPERGVKGGSSNNDPTLYDPPAPKQPGEFQKILLISGAVFMASLAGFIIAGQLTERSPESQPAHEPNPESEVTPTLIAPTSTTLTPSSPIAAPSENTAPSNTISIGWMRLGAVNSTGTISVGDMLVATDQPVTIAPTVVPSIGSQVVTITGVNLRNRPPQSASDTLGEKVSVLQPNQSLKILGFSTFISEKGGQPHTAVWAEVGLVP
ncbi:MAG: serine/threonine protein kinase [Oscillatoriales cyanobacterium]|nr:MAG: serine/threonine protein kinase [Oscillatoriales cyanobacterium]